MAYIGKVPTAVPLGTSDLADNIVTVDKLATTLDLSGNTITLPSGVGGKVLQVVQASFEDTATTTTSTSFVATGLDVSITPSSTSSKILVRYDLSNYSISGNKNTTATLYRNGTTNLGDATDGMSWGYTNTVHGYPLGASFLDSPSSTSELTYEVYIKTNGGTLHIGGGEGRATHNFITAMEIAG
jgi:hypothetical protein